MPARAAANRDFVSTFYRVGRRVEFLRTGDRYCNRRNGRVVEVAEILRLSTDAAGIMHAHFELTAYCLGRRDPVGQRALALSVFLANFHERLAADASAAKAATKAAREPAGEPSAAEPALNSAEASGLA